MRKNRTKKEEKNQNNSYQKNQHKNKYKTTHYNASKVKKGWKRIDYTKTNTHLPATHLL